MYVNYKDNLTHMNYTDNISHMNYIDNLSPTTWRGLFTGARTSWSVFMVATGKYVDKNTNTKTNVQCTCWWVLFLPLAGRQI